MPSTPEYSKNKRLERITRGLCPTCGNNPPKEGRKSCATCLQDQKDKYQRYKEMGLCSRCVINKAGSGKLCESCLLMTKHKRDEFKKVAFEAYGNRCQCCGETEPVFLSIDHVNNDGAEYRRNKAHPRGGALLCGWLIKQGFPKDFQLLCHNCQWGKRMFGVCPHQTKAKTELEPESK